MRDERPDKQEIIQRLQIEARRLGRTPSRDSFVETTEISWSDIQYHWPRWNDAVREAGLVPNEQTMAKPLDEIAADYLKAVKHYKEIPTANHLRVFSRQQRNEGRPYTSHDVFNNIGKSKSAKVEYALQHARQSNKWDDVIPVLEGYLSKNASGEHIQDTTEPEFGFVYLMAEHGNGSHYKIGCAKNPEERLQNLQTGAASSLQLVHTIKTDDMHGVEKYWHLLFESRRQRGEWYGLSSEDVNAFRRWRKIF